MAAKLVLRRRIPLDDTSFAQIVIWRVTSPVRGSHHDYKYSLALIVDGTCVMRYDNEAGKGDHRHVDTMETPYRFSGPRQLIADFRRDIQMWRKS